MGKDPAVLFYTSDFLAGTSFFTKEQRGEYITLLCEQHQLWTIPAAHLVEVCGSLDSPVVKKFVPDPELPGCFYNVRMREETIKRRKFCDSRRAISRTRGMFKEDYHPKQHKKDHTMDRMIHHTMDRMGNENENRIDNTDKKGDARGKKKRKQKTEVDFVPPTEKEFCDYCVENGFSNIAKRAFKYYSEQNWIDSRGNKIRSWKGKLQAVWFRPENRDASQESINWDKVFDGKEKNDEA